MSVDRQARLRAVRAAMADARVEACLLSLGADLPWLSGYEAMPLERPTVLVVPADDEATLVVPLLEAPRVAHDPALFALTPYAEGVDAVALVGSLLGSRRRLAISDRAFAGLLVDLQRELPEATFGRASVVTGPVRAVKDASERDALIAAGAAADEVADALLSGEIALIGRTEAEVSAELGARLLAAGHRRVNFAIVGSGPNAASPHHEAGGRRIGRGETVVCDFGGVLNRDGDVGYCSDITRTVVTGEPSAELRDLYGVLEQAQAAAVAAVRPGATCEEIDRAARAPIEFAGYGDAFIHRTGHGIGIEEHEDPYIIEGNATPLVAGHAFSVEPGIYLAGRMGARIEDIVVVTEDASLACNRTSHALTVVEA